MMAFLRHAAASLLCFATAMCFSPRIASAATPDDIQMATQVLQLRQMMLTQAQSCEAHYVEKGRAFKFIEFFWEGDYFEVLHGATQTWMALPAADRTKKEQVLREQDQQLRATASKRSEADWNTSCGDLYTRLVDKEGRRDAFDKPVRQRMTELYAKAGQAFLRRDSDYTIGCMKTQYNHGLRDFDTVKKVCSCVTDAITSSATAAQLEAQQSHPETMASQPWFSIAAPKINACKALWGANPH